LCPAKTSPPAPFEDPERGPWSNAPVPALVFFRFLAAGAREDGVDAADALPPDEDEAATLPACRVPLDRPKAVSVVLLGLASTTAGNGALAGCALW
jgi:hypothetical protein